MVKILLVEDERTLSLVIAKGLTKLGYAIDCAFDGEEALNYYGINEYDLIILDLNLPQIDGIEVLKEIRKKDIEIKILILSARSEVNDKILGLDSGGNDYITKPFDFRELDARIRNLIRRSFIQQNTDLCCNRIIVKTVQRQVLIDGEEIHLTKKEYSILEYLIMNKNNVISTEKIIEHVWDSEVNLFSNSFKFHMHSLKKKMAIYLNGEEVIKNVRGHGYIISK